jgi:heme A synthase
MTRHRNRLSRYAWGVLLFNVGVILFGAFVRATGSGAGCGSNWPLCDGAVLPMTAQAETLIEYTHRVTSGVAMLMVFLLVWIALRTYPKGHPVRKAAVFAGVFMIAEALIGASLVLQSWVAGNTSWARALASAVHLGNTYLLLGSLTLGAWWISGRRGASLAGDGRLFIMGILGLGTTILLGMTGAITALGDTLFPARSLGEGVLQDLRPTAHFLVRLRVIHPLLAVLVSLLLFALARTYLGRLRNGRVRWLPVSLVALVSAQLVCGAINLVLLAPIVTQILHLLLADAIWIVLVLLTEGTLFPDATVPLTLADEGLRR